MTIHTFSRMIFHALWLQRDFKNLLPNISAVAHATNIDEREPGLVNPPENLLPRASPPPTVPPDLFEGEQGEIPPQGTQCPPGKTTRF